MEAVKYTRTKTHRINMSSKIHGGISFIESFINKIDSTGDCWIWNGAKNTEGYGQVGHLGNIKMSYRVSYQMFVGDLKEGHDIHHICKNKSCVKPSHLKQLSKREHMLEGNNVGAINSRKTHCINNHLLSKENCFNYKDGRRVCKICKNKRERFYYNMKKENNYASCNQTRNKKTQQG